MAKAIFVMDIPESCSMCPLEKSMKCCTDEAPTEQYTKEKPSWCPLKPMPEKREQHPFPKGYEEGWDNGWNACIDAICGKE